MRPFVWPLKHVITALAFARRASPLVGGIIGAAIIAYAVAVPSQDANWARLLLYLLIAMTLAVSIRPEYFVALSVLGFAVSTAWTEPVVSIGSAAFYASDLMLVVIATRGFVPRERYPAPRLLGLVPVIVFAAWFGVLFIASLRGNSIGTPFVSAVRVNLALVYYPLLYFGFSAVLRERGMDRQILFRWLAVVALGLAAWMFAARAFNHSFHDPGLALVPTGPGETVARNFGFAAAFIVYPALALTGLAGMAYAGERRGRWAALAIVGTIATLVTLVRGEIFSLALGAVVILLFRPRGLGLSRRWSTAFQLALAVVTAVLAVGAISPSLGSAIVQRALPFTNQAKEAEETAQYRYKALSTGFKVAKQHPSGLGALDNAQLAARNIDPGYLAHSGVARLLIIGGWPAFIFGLLLVVVLITHSFFIPTPSAWLQAAFVGVLTMLAFYTVGAAGLVGDTWVIPLGALAVALRYILPAVGPVPTKAVVG